MPPTRVGDTWTFDVTPGELGTTQVHESIGILPAETYHVTVLGDCHFDEPPDGPHPVGLTLDLDGFVPGTEIGYTDYESGLYAGFNTWYDSGVPAGQTHRHTIPIVGQAVTEIPENCELRVGKARGDIALTLNKARYVFTVVTPS